MQKKKRRRKINRMYDSIFDDVTWTESHQWACWISLFSISIDLHIQTISVRLIVETKKLAATLAGASSGESVYKNKNKKPHESLNRWIYVLYLPYALYSLPPSRSLSISLSVSLSHTHSLTHYLLLSCFHFFLFFISIHLLLFTLFESLSRVCVCAHQFNERKLCSWNMLECRCCCYCCCCVCWE